MKATLILSAVAMAFFLSACDKEEDNPMKESSMFKVTIENVMDEKDFQSTGVFNTPSGASEPGGAGPGNMYQFSFEAGPGAKFSFATMYVKSNDLFYGTLGEGIELYQEGTAISGDMTACVVLLDAGTEVNEEPGTGPNQPLNGGPGVGSPENGMVKEISMINDGFSYPEVADNLMLWIDHDGNTGFTITIKNLEGSSTPIAPGVWVIHGGSNPLYEVGMADYGSGLKGLAEDGDPSVLATHLEDNTGYVSPLAPGAWAVHSSDVMPIFSNNMADLGEGLEDLAEDGNPANLASALSGKDGVSSSGAFDTPSGASGPGPLMPGHSYEFTFDAEEGDYLSFATMLVHTNDLFFSPSDMGIALFTDGTPMSGELTSKVMLYDAGTEVNELPGVGLHQPARLNGGMDENGVVKVVMDGFSYPATSETLKITITPM